MARRPSGRRPSSRKAVQKAAPSVHGKYHGHHAAAVDAIPKAGASGDGGPVVDDKDPVSELQPAAEPQLTAEVSVDAVKPKPNKQRGTNVVKKEKLEP